MTTTSRRGHVTNERQEETRKLRLIWEVKCPQLDAAGYSSQAAFGEAYGAGGPAATSFFLNGRTALSVKAAAAFARGLGCKISDFSPRLAAIVAEDSNAQAENVDETPRAAVLRIVSELQNLLRSLDAGRRLIVASELAALAAAPVSMSTNRLVELLTQAIRDAVPSGGALPPLA